MGGATAAGVYTLDALGRGNTADVTTGGCLIGAKIHRGGRIRTISGLAALSVLTAASGHAEAATFFCGGSKVTITGTVGDDVLKGTAGRDVFLAFGGDDVIHGRKGPDVICGGDGDDVIFGGRGHDVLKGQKGRDVLIGRRGHDLLQGGHGKDALAGNIGHDELKAGRGSDILDGGWGRDTLIGKAGTDTVTYASSSNAVHVDLKHGSANGKGRDRLRSIEGAIGSKHDDVLEGNAEANELFGGRGRDLLIGRAGDDSLLPDRGDDRVEGGMGSDLVSWIGVKQAIDADLERGSATGAGHDVLRNIENLQGTVRNDELRGDGGDNLIMGNEGDDLLDGRSGSDIASYRDTHGATVNLADGTSSGGAGEDSLTGFEGLEASFNGSLLIGDDADNLLLGGPGRDRLHGGAGDDELLGGDDADDLYPGPGSDFIDGGDQFSDPDVLDFAALPGPVEVDLAAGVATAEGIDRIAGIEAVWGSRGDDRLIGDLQDNRLEGRDGDDSISGADGFDYLIGGAGNDELRGDGWDDYLEGGSGEDELHGGEGHDSLYGDDASTSTRAAETDRLFGGGGWDNLGGEEGDDIIDGGDGFDEASIIGARGPMIADLAAGTMSAQGNDSLTSIEIVKGTTGDDDIKGDDSSNYLSGGSSGNDLLEGRGGADILQTRIGADSILGGSGDDHIAAGDGSDDADGGDGIDFCAFVETPVSCEESYSPDADVFEGPYRDWSWNGYVVPRSISLYQRDTKILGRVASADGCVQRLDVVLERKVDDGWERVKLALVRPWGYSFELPETSGTYRVHALARPPGDGGPLCARAVSEEFTI